MWVIKMAKTRLGKRIVHFEGGVWTTTINGKTKTFKKYSQLKAAINIYESNKGVRKGKRILERLRQK